MKRGAVVTILVSLLAVSAAAGGEIGFIEDFSLAKDRTVPLGQLIPGTRDYYYYHCLHYQNTGQFEKVDDLLKLWIKRYQETGRVREVQNRQALLTYDKDPAKSLEFLRWRLGLHFNHQKEILGKKPDLPIRLDQKLIGRDTLTKRALGRHGNLQGFEDAALEWVAATDLSGDRRRALLRRLTRPDVANLVRLVVDDLNYQHSGGFGSHKIHGAMLLSQLDALLKAKPDLLNEMNFVQAYLTKLQPSPDADWQHDPKAREAYLERMWSFVQRLAPVHNSLKAHEL